MVTASSSSSVTVKGKIVLVLAIQLPGAAWALVDRVMARLPSSSLLLSAVRVTLPVVSPTATVTAGALRRKRSQKVSRWTTVSPVGAAARLTLTLCAVFQVVALKVSEVGEKTTPGASSRMVTDALGLAASFTVTDWAVL